MEQLELFPPHEFVDFSYGMTARSTRTKEKSDRQKKSTKLFFVDRLSKITIN